MTLTQAMCQDHVQGQTMCMPSEKSGHDWETHTMLQQNQTIFMNRTWLILNKIHPER